MALWTMLFVATVAVTALLVTLVIDGHRRLVTGAGAIALFLLWLPTFGLVSAELLGRARPVSLEWLRQVPEAELLAAHAVEGRGIWLWLRLPGSEEPRAYVLPWDRARAEALLRAQQQAEERGTGLVVRRPFRRSTDDREPMFHPLPQPALPPKPEPAAPLSRRSGRAGRARRR